MILDEIIIQNFIQDPMS